MSKPLKIIATLKILRGTIALGVTFFLAYIAYNFLELSEPYLANKFLIRNDPFLQIASTFFELVTLNQVLAIGLLALLIAILRYVEAVGIWNDKNWARWLVIATGFIYIPFEAYLLMMGFSWAITLILVINLLVVAYLLYQEFSWVSSKANVARSNRAE